jgi:hypothetical protein
MPDTQFYPYSAQAGCYRIEDADKRKARRKKGKRYIRKMAVTAYDIIIFNTDW